MSDASASVPKHAAAAAYVRMSTEHQQYSLSNQMDAIREFALKRDLDVIKVYADEGKSGLSLQGREALTQMISDVTTGATPFGCVIVYDVSRWGRFQDADESAYYEYLCRRAGISIHYCAEQFENDGSPIATIVKSVKRAMAGEYSRELSAKVFKGACRLIQLGYKQGGVAGYGLRRVLVDQFGNPKAQLGMGEHKSLQTDRVILVPGPADERETVQWMYSSFVNHGNSESEIARDLNSRGILTHFGRRWTRATVHVVLTNEKYIGNNVYHRTSFKLKKRHVANPPDKWIRADGAFEALVDPALFASANQIILSRSARISDSEMLARLRRLYQSRGRISGFLIDEEEGMPCTCVYRKRFGSLVAAYRLIGYSPEVDYGFIEANRRLRAMHPEVVAAVVSEIESHGGTAAYDDDAALLRVNEELWVSVVMCRHASTAAGASRWTVRLEVANKADLTIAIRMQPGNESIRDYYILPHIDILWRRLRVAEENGVYLDAHRYESLAHFCSLARRHTIALYES